MLFFNTSKIQFESKSQRNARRILRRWSCFSIRQRYNLKANHNSRIIWVYIFRLFFNTSKIQFESKSQLHDTVECCYRSCFSIRQRYNLKANHNREQGSVKPKRVVFQYVKDTIWKQITTKFRNMRANHLLFFNTSKIQFESKSQLSLEICGLITCCFSIRQRYNLKANHNMRRHSVRRGMVVFQYVKDTIWKQITTVKSLLKIQRSLFFNTSKIQFESKSQHNQTNLKQINSCFSIRQRYNLKANHNSL